MSITDYRALCAELVDVFDNPSPLQYKADVLARARALLDQPVAEGPTDEELTLVYAYAVAAAVGNKRGPFKSEDAEAAQLAGLRAVLDKWGRPTPHPPAAGEVAELVAWLRIHVSLLDRGDFPASAAKIARAADLLQRQHPQPVAVSERPWERTGWCDAEGRCWLRRKHEEDGVTWRLMAPTSVFDDAMPIYYAEALPANALPTPEAQ